jgi:hypothetical protein
MAVFVLGHCIDFLASSLAAVAAVAWYLVAAWPVSAANAHYCPYWEYGVGNRVWGYTEAGQGWQGNGDGYRYYQGYSAGYQQGLSDAQTGLTYDCSRYTQYYCNGYSQGFNTYENNSQQETQTQGAEINVKGNDNYIGVNQEEPSSIGSIYPALRGDNNGDENRYDSSIQPGQANPSCKVICLTIVR